MRAEYIPYDRTGYLASLAMDYLNDRPELRSLYDFRPEIRSFREVIRQRQGFSQHARETLSSALQGQYKSVGLQPEVRNQIEALRDSNTFTVTTGHQLGLFGGPLYFVYKIISTLNLAKQLKEAYPGHHFVPIFWMASEDHDFVEINHFRAFGHVFRWDSPQQGAVGRFRLEGLQELMREWEQDLPEPVLAQSWYRDFVRAYSEHATLGEATRFLVDRWFGAHGVVCVDGDDAALKQQFIPQIKRELFEQCTASSIGEANKHLEKLGYSLQVHHRDINLFYLGENSRERIVTHESGFALADSARHFSRKELEDEVRTHPERFSPNALLRPVYQETILPNLAYLGGGAEVAYWLQLKPVFGAMEIPYPVVMLRNSVLAVNEHAQKKMHGLELSLPDVFHAENALIKQAVTRSVDDVLQFEQERQAILGIYKTIETRMVKADKTLSATVKGAMVKQINQLNKLEAKLLRAEKRNHEVVVQRVKALKEWIAPLGKPQERIINVSALLHEFGPEFIPALMPHVDPFRQDLTVVFK